MPAVRCLRSLLWAVPLGCLLHQAPNAKADNPADAILTNRNRTAAPPCYPVVPGCPAPGMPGYPAMTAPGAAAPTLPGTPTQPGTTAPGDLTAPPAAGAAAAAAAASGTQPSGGGESVASAAPFMIGDLGVGGYARQVVRVRQGTSVALVPIVTGGAFKIEDNESPRPVDRVFINYNYFNDVGIPGISNFNLNREVVGFEKTFLGGDASVGLRLNFLQTDGAGALTTAHDGFGDLTIITKYAFLNNFTTGNVVSGGLALTVPTSRDVFLADGTRFDPVLFQPYGGFIYNLDNLYALGFASIIVPTDARDAVISTESLALGYRLYQATDCNSIITGITPTVEGHATIPFSKRGLATGTLIGFPDIFDLTTGVHVGIGARSLLTTAVVVPLTGPKPFDIEAVVQFNFRF
jgi:hypothetical protein